MTRSQLIELDQYISPDGEVYKFHDGVNRFLMSFTGMGMPPIEYITQRGPFQHGESIIDYRLNKRIIQYVHQRNAGCRQGYWENRADLINLLRPNRQAVGEFALGTLRKYIPGSGNRDIDVFIQQGPAFNARDLDTWTEYSILESLRFIAPDPTFYDPVEIVSTWTLTTSDHLVFPFTFRRDGVGTGMIFGTSVIDNSISVAYTGTWKAFPQIEIDGPISGFTITNITMNEFIKLDYVIPVGETVTVSLQYGNKTVTNLADDDLIGTVTTASYLSTFHIAPDPEASGGVNVFSVLGSGTDGNTEVRLCYNPRYIGI